MRDLAELSEQGPETGEVAKRKERELIEAQVAAFAAERLASDRMDVEHLLNNITALAAEEVPPPHLDRDLAEFEKKRAAWGDDLIKEVATLPQYVQFLREVGGSNYEPIARRTEMLKEFGRFEDAVVSILKEAPTLEARKAHPSYLGSGSAADAFLISDGQKEYVARIPRSFDERFEFKPDLNPRGVDDHMRKGMSSRGIPHLEQVVAASYEFGATVSERMPGVPFDKLDEETLKEVSDGQLGQLMDTLDAGHDAGILFDIKQDNFFYDKDEGFGVIDYEHPDYAHMGIRETAFVLRHVAKTLDGKIEAPADGASFRERLTALYRERYAEDLYSDET